MFWVQGSGFKGSEVQGFSPAAGGEAASLIEEETSSKPENDKSCSRRWI